MTNSIYQAAGSIPLAVAIAGLAVPTSPLFAEQTIPAPSWQITSEIRFPYVLGNAGMTIRVCAGFTGDHVVDNYQPRTELGRKLLALRRAYVTTGGQLLDGDALDAEMRLRRGSVVDV